MGARLQLVRRLPWDARIEALRAGLLVASPEEALAIGIELIEMAVAPERGLFTEQRRTRADRALQTLAGVWDRLPEEPRAVARQVGQGRWAPAIWSILSSGKDTDECRGAAWLAAELAASLDEVDVSGSLSRALALSDPATRATGEAGLLRRTLLVAGVEAQTLEAELNELDAGHLALVTGAPLSPSTRQQATPVERAMLETHLADAAWGFGAHQRRLVLVAALAAMDLAGLSAARRDDGGASGAARLRRLLQEPGHVAHRALRQILRWSPAALVRHRALLLLAEATIAEACVERLTRADTPGEHDIVLEWAHLGRRPIRRRALAQIRVRAQAPAPDEPRRGASGPALLAGTTAPATIIPHGAGVPDERSVGGLSPRAQAGLGGFLRTIDSDDQTRAALLEPLVSHPSAPVRLSALEGLPRASLSHFCFDTEAGIARSALLRWSTAGLGARARAEGGERLRLATLLTRSTHGTIRALARREVERESAWMPESAVSRASAWRLALRDRDALLAHVRALVRGSARGSVEGDDTPRGADAPVRDAIAALGMARRLGLVRVLGADLAELLSPGAGTDPRLAASAASALGDVDDAIGRAALRGALEHPDPRVRANAVEAIGVQRLAIEDATTGRDRDHGALLELKGDPHHRVRANAIRALLRAPAPAPKDRRAARRTVNLEAKSRAYEPDAVEALAAMLGDARPMHRLAGNWLAGRVLAGGRDRLGGAWHRLSTMVAEAGGTDPDAAVRRRATHAASRIRACVRAGWAGASAGIEAGDGLGTELPVDPMGAPGTGAPGLGLAPAEPGRL